LNRFIILFLLLTSEAFAQKPYSEVYYPFIDKAEAAIVNGDYKEAGTFYQSAFSGVKHALARDVFNAAACRIVLNDFDSAKPYLLKLAAKGIPPELLQNEEIILRVFDKWEVFKPIYLQIYDNYLPSLSNEVSEALNELKSASPKIIRSGSLIEIKADNPVYISENSGSVKSSSHYQVALEKLLDSTGGFYEHQSGITDQDLLLDNLNSEVFNNPAQTIYFSPSGNAELKSKESQHLDMDNYILQGIENGKWHRDIISQALNTNLEDLGVYVTQISIEETCTNLKSGMYYKLNKKTFRENKYSFTEESLDLILKKATFKHTDNIFKLSLTDRLLHQVLPSCETAEKVLKDWTLVK
jgi:hypothetical protein